MIRLRKECPEVGWGEWRILKTSSSSVLGMLYEWRNNCLVTLHNFSEKPQDVSIDVNVKGGQQLKNLLSNEDSDAVDGTLHRIVLEEYGYRWYRVGGLQHIHRRQKY